MKQPRPPNVSSLSRHALEAGRLEILRACHILDTLPEKAFDDLARLAALICRAPIALISFVDEDRLWLKSRIGTPGDALPRRASFCDAVVQARSLVVVSDASADPAFAGNPFVEDGVRFYAGAPLLMAGDCVIGTLCVMDHDVRQLTAEQTEALAMLAEQVAVHLELRRQAIRDPLTGLFNRRYLEEVLQREIARAQRHRHSLGLLMLDMDHFKEVNDTLGHAFGDGVLRVLAGCLRSNLRSEDIASRIGGDEFVVILPSTSLPEAKARVEQLRRQVAVELAELIATHRPPLPLTISAGVAVFPAHGSDPHALLGSVDRALYSAKARGRDCVVVAEALGTDLQRRVRVLVVDDYEDSRELYAEYLRMSGMEVTTAADGLEGLEVALSARPDIIVMDLRMPRLDGFEATRRLKADPRTGGVPVLALTGGLTGAEEESRAAGCDAFLQRPCLPQRLLAEIRRLV